MMPPIALPPLLPDRRRDVADARAAPAARPVVDQRPRLAAGRLLPVGVGAIGAIVGGAVAPGARRSRTTRSMSCIVCAPLICATRMSWSAWTMRPDFRACSTVFDGSVSGAVVGPLIRRGHGSNVVDIADRGRDSESGSASPSPDRLRPPRERSRPRIQASPSTGSPTRVNEPEAEVSGSTHANGTRAAGDRPQVVGRPAPLGHPPTVPSNSPATVTRTRAPTGSSTVCRPSGAAPARPRSWGASPRACPWWVHV